MNRLRLTLDFVTSGIPPKAIAELRAYLAGMLTNQEMGTRVGPRDLERSGFVGVRLVAAELEEEGEEVISRGGRSKESRQGVSPAGERP